MEPLLNPNRFKQKRYPRVSSRALQLVETVNGTHEMFTHFYTQIQQRFFEAGWEGPWSWGNLDSFLFFIDNIKSVEDFRNFLISEMPQRNNFHPKVFLYICKILVFKMQIFKCWTQEEEAVYLKMLVDYEIDFFSD